MIPATSSSIPGGQLDAIVIGGSYAGLSAALQLARARRRVLVLDAGRRRNRFARAAHGFLAQDGRPPAEIVADARAQLLRYPTAWVLDRNATGARGQIGAFTVETESGESFAANRLVLAIGVADEMPAIAGVDERWGSTVFHCPYCHGYETNQGRLGVLAASEHSLQLARMLPDWGQTALLTNGVLDMDAATAATLAARGVSVRTEKVLGIVDACTVLLEGGDQIVLNGLFVSTRTRPSTPVAEWLGCEHFDSITGPAIRTDTQKSTTVPGVFACGDTTGIMASISFAASDGHMAGVATHRSLVFD